MKKEGMRGGEKVKGERGKGMELFKKIRLILNYFFLFPFPNHRQMTAGDGRCSTWGATALDGFPGRRASGDLLPWR
jgi:hypothetical protein